ncbi:hypothetical protein CDAR_580521 [Caerostris darwini]|uniref:Uncharacterized protein n=1 Tax=Caerostris darwini TaxID=1538125 RepID=A0AAV4R6G0_9ARAC|nr:hypothetical protein CDAR_580521 [Caerostris darwini]
MVIPPHPHPRPQIRRFRWRDHPKQQLFILSLVPSKKLHQGIYFWKMAFLQTIVPATPPTPKKSVPPPLHPRCHPKRMSYPNVLLMEPPLRE